MSHTVDDIFRNSETKHALARLRIQGRYCDKRAVEIAIENGGDNVVAWLKGQKGVIEQ